MKCIVHGCDNEDACDSCHKCQFHHNQEIEYEDMRTSQNRRKEKSK